ncbi:phospholipase A2, putative [Plasmodium ovale wallikeri]|uniref:Phospholipase A2, putative n=1 Tax=Plasmodium ovale wallikeri TaxID=864142 RepID=A0A1A8YK67_PLAOA|nr:phospholipase A2, putative [Plasmodium ovale wallikeri]SBT32269.1 phospholipase A2, putative [Plasmodium ovale wallikeri]
MSDDDDEKIYIYSDLFTKKFTDDEKDDIYEKEKKKKAYSDEGILTDGENEYSKLRAETSTILNNYFYDENLKNSQNDDMTNILYGDVISFPLKKNNSIVLFNGELNDNKHSVKLRKSGFYCIFLENNNAVRKEKERERGVMEVVKGDLGGLYYKSTLNFPNPPLPLP